MRDVADVLKDSFRETDILARIGGDEFVVLAVDTSIVRIEIISNHIQDTFEMRNQHGNNPYHLALNLGIADCDPSAPSTINELITEADGLMYLQKQAEKGRM